MRGELYRPLRSTAQHAQRAQHGSGQRVAAGGEGLPVAAGGGVARLLDALVVSSRFLVGKFAGSGAIRGAPLPQL